MALLYAGQVLLGPVAQGLANVILDVGSKVLFCRKRLERLHRTVGSLMPRIQEIDRLDKEINDRRNPQLAKLQEMLEHGQQMVLGGSEIKSLDYIAKYRYSKKVIKLNKNLLKFFQLELPAEILLDEKKILGEVMELNRKVDRLNLVGSGKNFVVGEYYCGIPQLPHSPVGLGVPLNELKMKLFQDGNSVVGLCAYGGYGKTTLASMLCRDDQVKGKFKKICFLTVSSSSNWMLVLQRLWKQIRHSDAEFLSIEDAVTQVECVLGAEPEPILLVLDDVWSEPVLRKHIFKQSPHKLLVTSRSVFNIFDSTYHLRLLGERDAKTLFCNLAFPEDGNYEKPNDNLVDQVVEGCKGYPLTLTVIGKSLCQKPARKWESVAKMLSEGRTIFNSHKEEVLDRLSLSVDFMKPKLRECFFDLGSFPEDHRIPAAALIDMWIELYNLDESDAYVNLLELSSNCLINLVEGERNDAGEIDGYFNELSVVQHDLLRDLAIHMSQETDLRQNKRLVMDQREDGLPKSWKEYQNQQFKARIVSIHTGEMDSSSWFEMEFPDAEVLILNFSGKNYCLPPFLRKMEKLKVLLITNHGSKHTKLSGFPLASCLPNLRRMRLEKISIPSLDEIKDPLKNLQKLSMVLCEVGEAMKNCSLEYSAIFPNLIEIDIDYCDDLFELPSGICEISNLQKLSVTNGKNLYKLPEIIDQTKDLEVLRLHACIRLREMPDGICGLKKLRFMDISDCLNMEKMPEDFGQLQSLRKLNVRKCSGLKRLPRSTRRLNQLEEVICDKETATLWEPLKRHLNGLEIKVLEEDVNLHWLGLDFSRNLHS